ncbi:SDR family NAD(P)-dependent oxidoreductase [Microvirga aerilata]|uniref:SDR family NAD(P)-dependent oxidoreductase n=1 Tax=Microvirga aerilata TaxID=670292 RepID=A0A936Z7A4_9HYPH|nr:SDR family NAD(P)-dependent oxidoreductase [Microvirga aerilata]MBL0405063.1 SDR family NAD(P)-dependent oxidoreductase [Microvirga aerilata]
MEALVVTGKNILVTGAGGFIGSHLVETLLRRGANVTAMVRYNSNSSIGNLKFLSEDLRNKLKIVSGNIEDSDFVFRAVEGQDMVLHLAALIAIPYSYVAPRSYVRANIEGTLNVLEAARRLGTGRVVHTSTSEVYGTARRAPIDEEHPLQGQSPYSASKIGADKIADSYYLSFDTPVVVLRPFNTFGPRQSARAFIPTIISQALVRDEIHLGSLTPQRDITFVADTVEGFILAGIMPGIEGETINLGTGETYSIGDFAQRILQLMEMDKPIVHDAARDRPSKSEVMKLVSDNSKAARLLGWRPTTVLDDGLRQVIEFISANRELYAATTYTV